jgi:hypothetical protein
LDVKNTVCNGSRKGTGYGVHTIEQADTDCKIIPGVECAQIKAGRRIEASFEESNHQPKGDEHPLCFYPGLGDSKCSPTQHNERHPYRQWLYRHRELPVHRANAFSNSGTDRLEGDECDIE